MILFRRKRTSLHSGLMLFGYKAFIVRIVFIAMYVFTCKELTLMCRSMRVNTVPDKKIKAVVSEAMRGKN